MHINVRVLIKILGVLTLIEGLFMLPCAALGLRFREWQAASPLFIVSLFLYLRRFCYSDTDAF